MIKLTLLTIVVIFFAMNMGGSGIAPSFAATWGSKFIKKRRAILLFSVFVMLGAVSLGRGVSITLGKNLLPKEVIGFDTTLIVLASASASLFLANILKIPQSTSQVTVGAIVGAGLYFKKLSLNMLFFKILPMWVILPGLAYLITLWVYGHIYPPEHDNLHIYQKLFANEKKLRWSSIAVSCYVAFAIGSNNVANAVGPLFGAGIIDMGMGLLLIAPLFGLGALVIGKGPLETAGKEMVPLGLISGTLVSFVTATLLLIASVLGIPQSLVQLNLASIFAISCLKIGHKCALDHHVAKRTLIVWAITPMLSVLLSYILANLFLNG